VNDIERENLGDEAPDTAELVEVEKQFGLPEETARLVAEDITTIGPRKPASYEVELERIRKAQELDEKTGG
jgi:hypothetical protein